MVTLWGTTGWSQPEKVSRGQRLTWETDWGFWAKKRNMTIVAGTMFWPGKDRILDSLRAEAWRDGIEDYEYMLILEKEIKEAQKSSPDSQVVKNAQDVMAQVKSIEPDSVFWRTRPSRDSAFLQQNRIKIARAIEALRNAKN